MSQASKELTPSRELAERLSGVLRATRYNTGGLMVALGGEVTTSKLKGVVQDRRLGQDALAQLARLFFLGVAVDTETAREAVAPADLDELIDAGLLHDIGDGVRGAIRVTPYAGLLIAHDSDESDDLRSDVVPGVNQAAKTLASLTPREDANTALDIGTGNGLQALLASLHSEHVVATDVNPRALAFTNLSAALSGIDNVETREGSLYEPVEGETFDLVVCNPPFVISPDTRFVYRDGGMEGDALTRAVLTEMPRHVAQGGLAQMLGNFVQQPAEEWAEPAKRCLDESGCDVLLLHHATVDALEYSDTWIRAAAATDPAAFPAELDRWTAHFAEQGIAQVASIAVTLRKRSAAAANWTAEMEMPRAPGGAAGEQLLRIIQGQDLLRDGGDEALSDAVLAPLPGHSIQRTAIYTDEGYGDEVAHLLPAGDAGLDPGVDDLSLALLRRLDGERDLTTVVTGLAAEVGAEPESLREPVLAAARSLLERGLVAVAAHADPLPS